MGRGKGKGKPRKAGRNAKNKSQGKVDHIPNNQVIAENYIETPPLFSADNADRIAGIAGTFFTGLSGVVAIAPHGNLSVALWLLFPGLTLFVVATFANWHERHHKTDIRFHYLRCAMATVLLSLPFGFVQHYYLNAPSPHVLVPPPGIVPLNLGPLPAQNAQLLVYLGPNLHWITNFPQDIVQQQRVDNGPIEPMLTLSKDDDGILVSGIFFDKDGLVLCKLDNNEITYGRHILEAKKTDHSLVVFDKENFRVIDIEYIDERSIRVLGDFYLRDGYHVVLTPDIASFQNSFGTVRLGSIDSPIKLGPFANAGTWEDPAILLKSYAPIVDFAGEPYHVFINGKEIEEFSELLRDMGESAQPSN